MSVWTSFSRFFKPPVTGWHVFAGVTLFFIVVGAVNIIFVVTALDSWSGLSTDNSYNKGAAYNSVLLAKRTQEERGWRSTLTTTPRSDGDWDVVAEFKDRDNNPISNLTVKAFFRRPTHQGYDQEISFTPTEAGHYVAQISLALKGQWDVQVKALQDTTQAYYAEQRLWIK